MRNTWHLMECVMWTLSLSWYWWFLLWMLYITKSSPSEHWSLAALQPKVPVILRSRINIYIYIYIYVYIYIYINTHIHIIIDCGFFSWPCQWFALERAEGHLFVTSSGCITVTLGWSAVVFCACEIILLCSVLSCVFTAVPKFHYYSFLWTKYLTNI